MEKSELRKKALKRIAVAGGVALLSSVVVSNINTDNQQKTKEKQKSDITSQKGENLLAKNKTDVYSKCDYYNKVTYGDTGPAHSEYCNANTYWKG